MSGLVPALALLVLFSAACGGNARSYLDKGAGLLAEGRYAEASLNYKKAIQKDTGYGEAYYELGLAALQLRRTRDAYQALSRAAELLPTRDDVIVKLADLSLAAYLMDSNHPKAFYEKVGILSDRLLARNPKSYDALRLKAYLASSDRRFAEAERLFRRANDVKPMQTDVFLGWVQALFENGAAGEAERLALQSIDRNKNFGPAYDELYRRYLACNRLVDAENLLKRKVSNNPADPVSCLQLAGFYADHAQPDRMEAALWSMLNNPQAFPRAHLQVGDFYAGRGYWDESILQFERAVEAEPNDRVLFLKRIVDVRLAQGEAEKAAPAVAEILRERPADEAAQAVDALLQLKRRTPEGVAAAVSQYKALVARNPDNPVWRYELGKALEAQGNAESARIQHMEAIRIRPAFVDPRAALAELSLVRGDYRTALRYASESVALDPDRPAVRFLHAVSLMRAGDIAKARAEMNRLEKDFPHVRKVQLQLAILDLKQGKLGPAEERFRKLAQDNHGDAGILSGLVQTLAARGRLDEALPLLQGELNRRPDSVDTRSLLAETALLLGKMDVAIDQYGRLAAAQPNEARRRLGLGRAYSLKGDIAPAIASYQAAAALAPEDPIPRAVLGQALASAGRRPEAVLSYRRALELQPDNAGFMNDLAYEMAESGGNLDEALKLAQQALEKDPTQPHVADTLGWIYLKQDHRESAIRIFHNLTQRYPQNPGYRYHLAMALLKKGDTAAARSELQIALSTSPAWEWRRKIDTALMEIGQRRPPDENRPVTAR